MFDDTWFGDPGELEARKSRAGYFASIEFVDENVGRIVEGLRARGVYDDLFVVWSSDHGDQMGDHYLWRKGFAMESSTHIPLVIRWPVRGEEEYLIGRGTVSDALVEVRDLAPTFWEMGGVGEVDDDMISGKSLLPLLRGEKVKVRDYLDLEENWTFEPRFYWNAIIGGEENMKYVA